MVEIVLEAVEGVMAVTGLWSPPACGAGGCDGGGARGRRDAGGDVASGVVMVIITVKVIVKVKVEMKLVER